MRIRFIIVWLVLIGVIGFMPGAPASAHPASVIVVPRDFPTIQAAVDAAAPGDTIIVRSGTYPEEVVIGKNLNLRGAGVGSTVIKSPARLTPYAVDTRNGQKLYAIVRIAHGAHVRISGLTVSGPVPCGRVQGVVAVQSANLELTNVRVSDMQPHASTCSDPFAISDRGVQFGLPGPILIDGEHGTTASGRVTGVVVNNFLSEGLVATGPSGVPPTSVQFADNIITAGTASYPTEQFGIHVFLAAVAKITGNTISGGVCTFEGCGPDPINQFQAMGVLVDSGGSGIIANNHISGSDVGIYQLLSPHCCQISQNTITANRFFGIVIQDGDGSTSQNTISGGRIGIGVVADAVDTVGVLRDDTIKNTSVARVKEIECCGFTATAIVK